MRWPKGLNRSTWTACDLADDRELLAYPDDAKSDRHVGRATFLPALRSKPRALFTLFQEAFGPRGSMVGTGQPKCTRGREKTWRYGDMGMDRYPCGIR